MAANTSVLLTIDGIQFTVPQFVNGLNTFTFWTPNRYDVGDFIARAMSFSGLIGVYSIYEVVTDEEF